MDKRKQEVIDCLINSLREMGLAYTDISPAVNYQKNRKKAEALYDRLLPLIRGEFPGEEIDKAVCDWWNGGCKSDLLSDFKRLWEGDSADVDWSLSKEPEHTAKAEIDEDKKVCQTCGGSKKKTHLFPFDHIQESCPDCKCLRCGVIYSEETVLSCCRSPGQKIGAHRWKDERSGEERRVELKQLALLASGKCACFMDKPGCWETDHRILKDRRVSDRGALGDE